MLTDIALTFFYNNICRKPKLFSTNHSASYEKQKLNSFSCWALYYSCIDA